MFPEKFCSNKRALLSAKIVLTHPPGQKFSRSVQGQIHDIPSGPENEKSMSALALSADRIGT